ncbi:MAG: MBL fold metallo-hydrolase, partial [Candidatus Palauibacterales bacterium]|nr:MBL fold metallo-hydrolase [Candidatus Palauibacterales bacterium]
EASLAEMGVAREDVDLVLSTHLHFDHAGGNTVVAGEDEFRPAFPNATYLIRRGEWEFAHRDNERIQASYLQHNFDPLRRAGMVEFLEGDEEVLPGVRTVRTPGHTPHHQSVIFEAGDETLCYLADLVPTAAHVPLPWIMGYDVEPLVTLESKRKLLTRAAEERWTLIFEHDPEVAAGRAVPSGSSRGGCELKDPRRHPAGAER